MSITVLNPTFEDNAQGFEMAPRLSSLEGKTVGFVSNGKKGTLGFFQHLERLLKEQFSVANVVWETKSNYSAPAEGEIIDRAQAWDLAITGLGD